MWSSSNHIGLIVMYANLLLRWKSNKKMLVVGVFGLKFVMSIEGVAPFLSIILVRILLQRKLRGMISEQVVRMLVLVNVLNPIVMGTLLLSVLSLGGCPC